MIITSSVAAILGMVYFVHSLRTIAARGSTKTNLGDGGSDIMVRRIRIHGNFAEYVPLLLIMLGLLEYHGAPATALWAFGISVVVGRLLHAYGLWSPQTPGWARIVGMQLTLWPLILGSLGLLYGVIY